MISTRVAGRILSGELCRYAVGQPEDDAPETVVIYESNGNRRMQLKIGQACVDVILLDSWIDVDGDIVVVAPELSIKMVPRSPRVVS